MQTELEAKFLDIEADKIRNSLKANGAVLIHPERLMRRKNFDYPDGRLEKVGGWIRVRDEGDKTTLAYKRLVDRTIEGTKEISLAVEDFEKISNLLLAIGLRNKSYQETKRERWELDGVEVTIDTWPWIPTFAELEGSSESGLQKTAAKLGLDWGRALHGSVENAYQAYYGVSEEEIDGWESITFVPVPEWLKPHRRDERANAV
jgi:adenylate cyclase, class 2